MPNGTLDELAHRATRATLARLDSYAQLRTASKTTIHSRQRYHEECSELEDYALEAYYEALQASKNRNPRGGARA